MIDKKGELEFKAKYLDKAINMLSMSTFQIIQNIRSFRAKRELEQIDENVELNSKPSLNNISKFVQNEEEKESSAKHQKWVSFQIPQKQEPNSEISNISKETLNIINNIRNKKGESINDKWISDKPKTEREYKLDGILNNISMKEKYSELIEGDSMLVLPTHFKILQKLMRVLLFPLLKSLYENINFIRGWDKSYKVFEHVKIFNNLFVSSEALSLKFY